MKKVLKLNNLRVALGTLYYFFTKNFYWYLKNNNFAKKISTIKLPFEIFSHKSLLLRKLKNVDMWMQENKIKNLEIAIKKINGIVLESGQTFSYWRQIGRPTKNKGYLPGMILQSGNVKAGVGGGLCQLSNLIYWITLHTPLTVVERWRHSYDVFPDVNRNQPFGSGATCSYPNIDLQIKNNTQQKFQLELKIEKGFLVGSWLSDKQIDFKYKIIEKDHEIKHEFNGKYTRNNKIFREIFDKKNNSLVKEELITENSAFMMYDPLLETKNRFYT